MRAAMKPLPTLMKPLALGRPRKRRAGPGARRALRRRRGRGARRRRRGGRRLGARRRRAREVRRRHRRRLRRRLARLPRADRLGAAGERRTRSAATSSLVGFMGAGKTRARPRGGRAARAAVRRPRRGDRGAGRRRRSPSSSRARGERGFRALEEQAAAAALAAPEPAVISLGGGAVGERARRARCSPARFVVCIEVDVDTAWARARPLAPAARPRRGRLPRALRRARARSTARVADARASDATGVVLAAGGVHYEPGALDRLGELVPGEGPVALRRRRDRRSGSTARAPARALGARLASVHELPGRRGGEVGRGRRAALGRARGSTAAARVVALGGGCTTDLAGFVAADLPARRPLGRGADDARRPGRRRDRRQDRHRHPGRQEPRRRVPLAGAGRHRRDAARDACPSASGARAWPSSSRRGCSPARELDARGAAAFKTALCLEDPLRPRPAAAAQPRPHLRPRARGRGRLRAAPRRGGRARAARGAAALGARHRRGRARARPGAGRGRPRARLGRRCCATRSAAAARSTSCCSATTGRYVAERPGRRGARGARGADRQPDA